MNGKFESIESLSDAVAQGRPVDWARAEREAPDRATRRVVRGLSILSRLAHAHRLVSEHSIDLPFVTWGHLRLVERVGQGSYGEVFRAWDSNLQQEVALKLYRAEFQSSAVRRTALLEEARNLARIRSGNVVRVLGADIHQGRVGFWMEFVTGETLQERVDCNGPLSAHEAVRIGIEICRGLSDIHAAGLLHCDLKPSNVFCDARGRICLVDFGSGAGMGTPAQLTGTPLYMAPETFPPRRTSFDLLLRTATPCP